MRILDSYVLREAVGPFFFGFAAFTSLLVVNILFPAIDMVNNGMAPSIVLRWMGYNLPELISLTLPMSTLLGTLLTFGRLSSASEITAMRAGGLGLWRIVIPILLVSLVLSGSGVFFNDRIVAPAKAEADRLITGAPAEALRNVTKENFYYPMFEAGKAKSIWIASRFDGSLGTLEDVYMFSFNDIGFSRVVYAKRASWNGRVWKFYDGYIQSLGSEDSYQAFFPLYTVINAPAPAQMSIPNEAKTANMTLHEHEEFIKLLASRGADTKTATIDYHMKLALPFACLVFALVGVPFGLQPNRGGSSVGLGLSVVLIFGYYLLTVIMKSIGQKGVIAPELAAWTPNIVFGAVGLVMMNRRAL